VVGLPSATVVLAANQRPMAERLEGAGLALPADAEAPDFEERLLEIWRNLVTDRALRWRLTERSAELCDGNGAERLADAVLRL
jgi:spore coat polysaccharide biosynthesis predicted glycosyltransferase SpsG